MTTPRGQFRIRYSRKARAIHFIGCAFSCRFAWNGSSSTASGTPQWGTSKASSPPTEQCEEKETTHES